MRSSNGSSTPSRCRDGMAKLKALSRNDPDGLPAKHAKDAKTKGRRRPGLALDHSLLSEHFARVATKEYSSLFACLACLAGRSTAWFRLRACLKNVWVPRPRPSSFVLDFAGNFEDEDEGRGRGRGANRIFSQVLSSKVKGSSRCKVPSALCVISEGQASQVPLASGDGDGSRASWNSALRTKGASSRLPKRQLPFQGRPPATGARSLELGTSVEL
jgi:hypothetical protein